MQASNAFAIFLITSFSSLGDMKRECGIVCMEWDWGYGNEKVEEIFVKHLKKGGPADGVCVTESKIILNGTHFGFPSKCVCGDIPTDVYIKPGDGPRCPDICIAAPEETFVAYWTSCHDAVKSFAPANGWCPKGQLKWVVKAEQIGRPHESNTCHCVGNYEFVSEEVKCIEVPDAPRLIDEDGEL